MEIDAMEAVGAVGENMEIEVVAEGLEAMEIESGTGVRAKMDAAVTAGGTQGKAARNEETSLAPNATSTSQRPNATWTPPTIETQTTPPIKDDPPRPFSELDRTDDDSVDEYLAFLGDEEDGRATIPISGGVEREIISISDDDGPFTISSGDEEDEVGAQDYWTSPRDNNVNSEQIRNHVLSSSVNEKLLDIGAIPAANPKKFEVNVEDDEDESLDDQIEVGDESELTMRSDETEEEFQKRVTAFKMYIPFPINPSCI